MAKIKINDLVRKKLEKKDMRKITGGTEMKYVNVLRYYAYIETSAQKDTTWTVYYGGKG